MPAHATLSLVPTEPSPLTVQVAFVLLTREHPGQPWTPHSATTYLTYLDAEIEQVRLAFAQFDRAERLDLRAERATTPLHRKRLQRAAHAARTREYAIYTRTTTGDLHPAD